MGRYCNFVRFAGCNLKCKFCDTDHSKYEELTVPEIWKRLDSRLPVVLTGGEPLLQPLEPLLRYINARRSSGGPFFGRVQIETNGTVLYHFDACDYRMPDAYLVMSPKPEGEVHRDMWLKVHAVKWLVPVWSLSEIRDRIREDHTHHFVQPVNYKKKVNYKNVQTCLEYITQEPRLRLSIQLHKVIGVR